MKTQHYQAIADAIADNYAKKNTPQAAAGKSFWLRMFTDKLAAADPTFDADALASAFDKAFAA